MTDLSRYADWTAPADDGAIIIWPSPGDILASAMKNHRTLKSSHALVQNTPLQELRGACHRPFGIGEQVVIATGHQTELYHPGVWVKNVLIHQVARKLDAIPLHLAVDTDSPKHLLLRWPGGSAMLTDDAMALKREWSGLMPAPSSAYLQKIEHELQDAARAWGFETLMPDFFAQMKHPTESSKSVSQVVADAFSAIDESLGVGHKTIIASHLWSCPAFAALVHHVCSRADEFAKHYNQAIAEYRFEQKISSTTRPMPDLAVDQEGIEVPFWFDWLESGRRHRARVHRSASGFFLQAETERFEFDPHIDAHQAAEKLLAWLKRHELRLAPRALTLTLFMRLFVVDQFVHGIGGGRYDQITDRLIHSHFKIDPPAFSVTTATLRFPASTGRSRTCLPCLLQEGHQLKHKVLGNQKAKLLEAINSAPRKSQERLTVFHDMQKELRAAQSSNATLLDWQNRWSDAQQRSREDAVMFDRELIYTMQTRQRLLDMVDRYKTAFESA